MKKILLLIVGLLFIIRVNALENYINLVNKNDKVMYESNLKNNEFIHHTDFLPGDSFVDNVRITNNSDKQIKLYLKVKLIDQSKSANNLLDNILMKVYLDNKIIYDGYARGIDYNNSGVNLQNVVLLKTFNNSDTAKLKVETSISTEFNDPNADESRFDFVLYGEYDDKEEEIIPVPITDKNEIPTWVFSIIICLIGIFMLLYASKHKNN